MCKFEHKGKLKQCSLSAELILELTAELRAVAWEEQFHGSKAATAMVAQGRLLRTSSSKGFDS